MAAGVVGAGEGGGAEGRHVHRDSQLLLELADQRRLGPLAGLDLAAGEFPQARHCPPRRPALQENPPRAVGERRRHHGECRIFLQIRGQRKDSVNSKRLIRRDGREPDVGKVRPMRLFAKLIRDTKAASAVEYALICALIVLAMIAGLNAVAGSTIGMWNDVSNNVVSTSN